MIYDHTSSLYVKKWTAMGGDRLNGAYYYSQEIVKNIMYAAYLKHVKKWSTLGE